MELYDIVKDWRKKYDDLRFGQWLYFILAPLDPSIADNNYLVNKIIEETGVFLPEVDKTSNFSLVSKKPYNKEEILELIKIIRSFSEKSFCQWLINILKPMDLFYIEDNELIERIKNNSKHYIVLYNDTKILLELEPFPIDECKNTEDYYSSREVIEKFNSEEEAMEGVKNLIKQTAINDCSFGSDVRKEFKNIKILEIKEICDIDINNPAFDEANLLKKEKEERFKQFKIEQIEKELENWKNK